MNKNTIFENLRFIKLSHKSIHHSFERLANKFLRMRGIRLDAKATAKAARVSNGIFFMLIFTLLATISHAHVIPYISIRSQSVNAARELVLWQTQINKSCMEDIYGSFSFLFEYTRSTQSNHMGRCLFNDAITNECCYPGNTCFQIQGSAVNNRSTNALLAENFGLPTDFESTISLYPRIENFIASFDFYLGLDRCVQGLYLRFHLPALHTRWELNFNECNINSGINAYPGGYFNGQINDDTTPSTPQTVDRDDLVTDFEDYAINGATPTITGINFHPLEQAKFYRVRKDDNKLAEMQIALGWNFLMGPDYHFGLNLRTAAPTGNAPRGEFIFEPIAGNGKHWELGLGLTTHYRFWQDEEENKSLALYLDANITHMFAAHQKRTFDLCNKPLSRYMLAAKMITPSQHLFDAIPPAGQAPDFQFADEYTAVANLTTIPVSVSAAVQSDIALKLAYTQKNFQIDVGYEFWQRSCEKICPRCLCEGEATTWALKGDAMVYGFAVNEDGGLIAPIPLSASDTDATIFCGNNNPQRPVPADTIGYNYWLENPGVDHAKEAFTDLVSVSNGVWIYVPQDTERSIRVMYSSFNPIVFSTDSTEHLDIKAAESKGLSNKLFVNFGYIWQEHKRIVPYLGIGIEAEFGMHCKECGEEQSCVTKNPGDATTSTLDCCSNNQKTCCMSCAISQAGIWFKGGISF